MDSHDQFTRWCLVATLYVIFITIASTLGWMSYVLPLDGTRISYLIIAVFLGATAWCGRLSWKVDGALKAQKSRMMVIARHDVGGKGETPKPLTFRRAIHDLSNDAQHGWFAAAACTSLGLVGTVIGFIIMLKDSFSNFTVGNEGEVQRMLASMTAGMGAAFVTTLVGVVCSLLIGIQFHVLDRAIGRLRK